MPLVTDASSSHKRRVSGWGLLAVLVLPLATAFAWSWFQPLRFAHQRGGILVGYSARTRNSGWFAHSNGGWVRVKLPGGRKTGAYGVGWGWQ
jgi:hypothetical protein